MKVGLVGPYPPPRGGVSVHCQRLNQTLSSETTEFVIFNMNNINTEGGRVKRKLNYLSWFLQFFCCTHLDILHIHVGDWKERAFLVFIARLRKIKTVITVHSLRDDLEHLPPLKRQMIRYALKSDFLIFTGEDLKNKLLSYFKREGHYTTLVPFIPPVREAEAKLPEHLQSFIEQHAFIVCANASDMNFYCGQDLYGLDMFIELCGQLHMQMDVGFIYCLTRPNNEKYLQKKQERIKELQIEDSFLLVTDSIEFWPVLERSHLFIRPTCTDSYGVSVAEALTLGVPSIASNVCNRPEGTVLFQSRDSEDLLNKVTDIINDYDTCKKRIQNLDFGNCAYDILEIYQSLM